MVRTLTLMSVAPLAAGCSGKPVARSEQSTQNVQTMEAPANVTVKASDGSIYGVERVSQFTVADLPSNRDLKMADGDIARYGMSLCDQNVAIAGKLKRCDLYVQNDKTGSLIGYAVVGQGDKGVAFYTTADLNPDKGGGALTCAFGGMLGGDVKDAAHDFDENLAYSAWEKEPGDWLISVDEAGDDQNFANGMWYVKKVGDKLRITQERWNPCYSSAKNGYIDDVFDEVVALTHQSSGQ